MSVIYVFDSILSVIGFLSFLCHYSQCYRPSGIVFFFQAEDGIRDLVRSRGLGDVYKRQQLSPGHSPVQYRVLHCPVRRRL